VCAYLSHHRQGNYEIKKPTIDLPALPDSSMVKVNIYNAEACLRYCGLSLTNITVGESPEWLKTKLNTIGVRSINNIVDITNFVLHEFGQPLHAFDADAVTGNEVNVRLAASGEIFKTLDEKNITLTANDLMICNAEKAMCLAGVYGGAESGVTEKTKNVFLESAYFHPSFIRRSSLHHGLRTDAATHFEKGVDMENVIPALLRAAQLMTTIAGAKIASKISDTYPQPLSKTIVTTTYSYINKLSGKDYSQKTVNTILSALGFNIVIENDNLKVEVPFNKVDVLQPADIVEEIVRIDGLDNIIIPEKLNIALLPTKPNDRKLKEKCAEMLCGEGLQEIVTNSVTNSNYYSNQTNLVKMINSLSSELDILRPSMLESGLEVISYNVNRKNNALALFEFGKTYCIENETYKEEEQLAMWFTGNALEASWREKAKPFDSFYVKGILQNLFLRNGIAKLKVSYENDVILWKYKNQTIAQLVKTNDDTLKKFDIKQDVYFAIVYWEVFVNAANAHQIKYAEVPKFPAMQRDLAIVLDKEITYQQVQQATEQLNIPSLKTFDLFDVFENEKLGADKKSYALNYTFQLSDRTLTDAEIEQHIEALIKTYETKLKATIRK
jgi:phenylalanyl-tRNA synthetase beta chain